MACGCPVACSDLPALAEVAGDAARMFPPDDPSAIAAAVRDVLADPTTFRERGIARAASFTWERAAAEYEDVYRDLL
jgi:glycosyltransferase involved in cell wall biosynthesis